MSVKGYRQLAASRSDARGIVATDECVLEEVPVALVFNGVSHAVMMATPTDLEDFALGFALSEGIVASAGDVRAIEWQAEPAGITVNIEISERCMAALRERRRSLTGRSGCGLCGVESLAQALRPVPRVTAQCSLSAAQLHAAFMQMGAGQELNHATGAAHAASWLPASGGELLLREDIGRHNALDKLIGARARQVAAATDGALLITSRASYEMLHKAAMANMPLVAAISAPSALAIDVAREAGITLLGFVRGEAMTCYNSGYGRLQGVDFPA